MNFSQLPDGHLYIKYYSAKVYQHGTTLSQGSGPNNTATIFTMETSVVMLAFELAQLVVIVIRHGMMPHGSGKNNTATILCIFPMEASIVSAHITK